MSQGHTVLFVTTAFDKALLIHFHGIESSSAFALIKLKDVFVHLYFIQNGVFMYEVTKITVILNMNEYV